MNRLMVLVSFLIPVATTPALARDDGDNKRFQSAINILGPITIGAEETLRLCLSDVSRLTASIDGKRENRWSKPRRKSPDRVDWSSTRIEIFDSRNTEQPLPQRVEDLVVANGKGACVDLRGYEMIADDSGRSVLIVLTTLTEARAVFEPLVSGQLAAPNNDSRVGLLVPAVQSARGSSGGGNSGKSCCACAPVCGCGVCD